MSLPGTQSSATIPKLREDASNWIDYKSKTLISLGSRGLMAHIEGRAVKPALVGGGQHVLADGITVATEDQIEALEKRIDDFETKQYLWLYV